MRFSGTFCSDSMPSMPSAIACWLKPSCVGYSSCWNLMELEDVGIRELVDVRELGTAHARQLIEIDGRARALVHQLVLVVVLCLWLCVVC